MRKGNTDIGSLEVPLPEPIFPSGLPQRAKPHQIELEDESVPDKIPSIEDEEKPNLVFNVQKTRDRPFIQVCEDLNNVVATVLNGADSERFSAKPESEEKDNSFWNRFDEFLKDKNYDESIINAVSEKDLFDKMKMFHDCNKQGKPFVFDEKDIVGGLSKKMDELKSLEKEWDEASRQLATHKSFIAEKENEIRNRINELKDIISNFKKVKKNDLIEAPVQKAARQYIAEHPQHYFYLSNGLVLKSLEDFKSALFNMADAVFYSHVSSDRNDFANWVRDVLKDSELADRIRMAASRQQLLELLQ